MTKTVFVCDVCGNQADIVWNVRRVVLSAPLIEPGKREGKDTCLNCLRKMIDENLKGGELSAGQEQSEASSTAGDTSTLPFDAQLNILKRDARQWNRLKELLPENVVPSPHSVVEWVEGLKKDAELGALVRKMPEWGCLYRQGRDGAANVLWQHADCSIEFATPEDAMRSLIEQKANAVRLKASAE